MADDYLTLTTFVPGTKAKADEVNANFSALKEAINSKATMNGDSTQIFSVAEATADSHAVNKSQLDDLSDDLTAEINRTGTRFCVKSGNISNGQGHLFSYNVLEITPLIAGAYSNLVVVDYTGTQSTISTTPSSIDLTGSSDGTYNIFITATGTLYVLNNKIYRQPKRPAMVVNDVWLNTSVEPFKCIKYAGSTDITFLDVPLGKVVISGGAITSLETFKFNQNGYNVSSNTILETGTDLAGSISNLLMPDYANGVSKSWATVYQAETNGYVYIKSNCGSTFQVSKDNSTWITVQYSWFSEQGYSASAFIPVPKGIYYKAIYSAFSGASSLVFYPCLAS